MRIRFVRASFALALVLIAPAALAQAQFPVIKTPPLADSDTIVLPVSTHIPFAPPWAGYAGAIVKAHILDNQELDVATFHAFQPFRTPAIPGPLPASVVFTNPFGPPSSNPQSVPFTVTYWNPNALQSGIPVVTSQFIPLASVGIHAKNTTPANNSDTDLTNMFWNIWHIRAGNGSTLVPLRPSDRLWVTSNIVDVGQLHTPASGFQLPPTGPTPFSPTAHWLHLTQPVTFHLTAGLGSAFYATFVGTVGLGIEHVPEPASGLLVAGGLLALGLGARARQRRLRMA
jgi:hypothetical protein